MSEPVFLFLLNLFFTEPVFLVIGYFRFANLYLTINDAMQPPVRPAAFLLAPFCWGRSALFQLPFQRIGDVIRSILKNADFPRFQGIQNGLYGWLQHLVVRRDLC